MKIHLLLVILLFSVTYIFSLDNSNDLLNKFFTEDEIKKVIDNEIISRMYIKYDAKGENTHQKIEIKKSNWTKEDFTKYEIICDEKAFFKFDLSADTKLKLFNIITNSSKLSGMDYYSRSSGKIEKLILEVYKIGDLKNKEKIEDLKYENLLPVVENRYLQQDNKFGKLFFKNVVENTDDSFVMTITNEVPITNIVKINDPGEYKIITFLIYDKKNKGYFYYSINALRVLPDFLLKNGFLRPTTFSNRLRAAYIHLMKQLGNNISDKLNPWDEEKLKKGLYRTF